MATTAKAVNFTTEQVTELKTAFLALPEKATAAEQKALVDQFATKFGKNARSIVAKASNLQIYRKAEKVTKTGAKIETKAEMVSRIAKKFDLSEEVLGSLESATKQALLEILTIPVADTTTE